MKRPLTIVAFISVSAFSILTFNVLALDPAPAAATAAKTVTELWKSKKFDKIESYVSQLSKRYPNRCCSVVASVTRHTD